MPRLFSYGSLQQPAVQRKILGRDLGGHRDEVIGFERVLIQRGDRQLATVVRREGAEARVEGTVFEITEAELRAVDAYEAGDCYVRQTVLLASGAEAWLYAEVER